jgi:hypothetical protein
MPFQPHFLPLATTHCDCQSTLLSCLTSNKISTEQHRQIPYYGRGYVITRNTPAHGTGIERSRPIGLLVPVTTCRRSELKLLDIGWRVHRVPAVQRPEHVSERSKGDIRFFVGGQTVSGTLAGDRCAEQLETVADDLRNVMQSSSESSSTMGSVLCSTYST